MIVPFRVFLDCVFAVCSNDPIGIHSGKQGVNQDTEGVFVFGGILRFFHDALCDHFPPRRAGRCPPKF
ncbi:hypothetical protein [Leisingera sp. ANG-Vp]|uniref:hypothetical protein n=1 Tax=Leisingera sp. ANG-Vp TaxID=1577896 RepID=UPI00126A1443|nr:hypothetical protein [Leisingera sp. ANG-Vp]